MSVYTDKKYIMLVSRRLDLFKPKSEYLFNFRCPLCGDSKKNRARARAYFFRRKSDMFFSCHNCSKNMSFGNFLKTFDKVLYDEYVMENFKDSVAYVSRKADDAAEEDFRIRTSFQKLHDESLAAIDLPSIDKLSPTHFAREYVSKRGIPKKYYSIIYYASDFKDFTSTKNPEKAENMIDNEKRLIFPFWDRNKNLLGYQGRALSESTVKYITVKLDETFPKVYGLDRADFSRPITVVEGPIDSLFLDNAIASMDSVLQNIIPIVGVGDAEYVFVFDNEPRNSDILRNIRRTIEMGQSVVIWPPSVTEKDINDMVLVGRNVEKIIHDRTYSGIEANLEYERWKKI